MLMVDEGKESAAPVRISVRNQLRGKVSSVTPGAVNAEVSLAGAGQRHHRDGHHYQ
ncbi:MAG: hypothetical protein CBARDMAM_6361 [uncultured Caballeronia sp.]|nr:MAG: hypothetical protein CBARDMAM_6361 [uncultured Caballeronia sp.]